jgi:hypothetical protein
LTGTLLILPSAESRGTSPKPPPYHAVILDIQPVRRTYYFVADHPVTIQEGSLRVWRDDGIPTNNPATGAMRGYARLDALRPPDSSNPETPGNFNLLQLGVDYTVFERWTEGSSSESTPVIRLTLALGPTEILAVTYVDESIDPPVAVGNTVEPDSLLLQALATRGPEHIIGPDGMYDPTAPWFPLLSHELRNYYPLGTADIPMERLRISIRSSATASDPDGVFGETYLEHLGLDRKDNAAPGTVVPDGVVDPEFVDPVKGILFFPDNHPFDPEVGTPGCAPGSGGFLCLDDVGRNVLRRDHPDDLARSNELVYWTPLVLSAEDSRFYLDITIVPPPEPGGVLRPNAPNPFNPGTTITFELNLAGHARLEVYDVGGRRIRRLLDQELPAGQSRVVWAGDDADGRAVPSGVYLYVLDTGGHRYSRKMVLAR